MQNAERARLIRDDGEHGAAAIDASLLRRAIKRAGRAYQTGGGKNSVVVHCIGAVSRCIEILQFPTGCTIGGHIKQSALDVQAAAIPRRPIQGVARQGQSGLRLIT